MSNCCTHKNSNKICKRKYDNKKFYLPRRFSRKKCLTKKIRGFTMRSSCAPYKYCKQKQRGGKRNKTKKRKDSKKKYAITKIFTDKNNTKTKITGFIYFTQSSNGKVRVSYDVKGLSDGKHGFHVHTYGDLTNNCMSSAGHFSISKHNHGGRKDCNRHIGDLGNIISKNKRAAGYFYDDKISLDKKSKKNIIGRMVVIHENEDDLGRGRKDKKKESLVTGNAGKRIACGIIGIRNHTIRK